MKLTYNNDDLIELGLKIRLVEEKIAEVYDSDVIQSPVHLSIGQEAVAIGVCNSMNKNDTLFINYRGHAYYLARNGDLIPFLGELCGKDIGISRGKAGSMHLSNCDEKIIGASAVVCSSLSNAIGYALGEKINNRESITVVVIGDGATEQGSFHESLNLASLLKVPILIICEDNGLAVHSPVGDRHAYKLENFASIYGIESEIVEKGYDPHIVSEACKCARKYILSSGRPYFLTIKTRRYLEHVGVLEDFDAGYRSRKEIEDWKENDPIEKIRENNGLVLRITKEIDEALAFVLMQPESSHETLLEDVY